jgi:hypothetical protein
MNSLFNRSVRALSRSTSIATLSVLLLAATSAFAQTASLTTVTSATNPSVVGGSVTLTANVTSSVVSSTFSAGVGRVANSGIYYRFDLIGTKFKTAPQAANLTNKTTPAAFSNKVVAQGGSVGDSYVVFQLTAGAMGIASSDVVQFNITP